MFKFTRILSQLFIVSGFGLEERKTLFIKLSQAGISRFVFQYVLFDKKFLYKILLVYVFE